MQVDEEITIADIDEAISHVYAMLKDDRYGNRLTHQRKEFLRQSIDDLLDIRLGLTTEGKLDASATRGIT